MPFVVPIEDARARFPEYEFVASLTPSEQKSAFQVRRDGKEYCLKIISPNYGMDRVQREVLAMQRVIHPNVVRIIDYEFRATAGEEKHYIVEEFVAGSDLTDCLSDNNPWTVNRITRIFGGLCDGLEKLRQINIVHRDIKPSNIRLRLTEEPVIIDFGLARHLDMASLTNTNDGAQIGTPIYFAPEQFTGTKRDIDHRTDLYALGILLYEAAVGFHPYMTAAITTRDQLNEAVCESDSYAHREEFEMLPKGLKTIIGRLLAKDKARRPASAGLVSSLLSKIAVGT